MNAARTVNLALRFVLELGALAAFVVWGVDAVEGMAGWLLGFAVAAVAAVVWGLLLAPKRRVDLARPVRLVLELLVFAAAAAALAAAGHGQLALIAFVVAVLGFFGGIVMSAIKRDAGVKDYGHLIEGHGGMMDRIDSLTFAAPIFFHVVRFYFVPPGG